MGIWEFLTKPIKLTSAVFYWQEPMMYRTRLRGDLLIRCVVPLAAWAAVSGLLGLWFAFGKNPPGLPFIVFGGALLGLVSGGMTVFYRREHVSGSVWVYPDHILRYRRYVSWGFFLGGWNETQEWPNECITRCVIIPNRILGKSFSVMLLKIDSTVEMIGIPNKIKLKELARHFTEVGIPVEKRDSLPDHFTEGFDPKIAAAISVVGVLILSIGLGYFFERVPRPGNKIAVQKNIPDLKPDFPQVPNPVQVVPNPVVPNPIAQDNQPNDKKNAPVPPAGKPNTAPPNIMPKLPGFPPNGIPNRFPNRPGGPLAQPGTPTTKPNPPNTTTNGNAASKGNDSKLIGNPEGGFPFRMVNSEGKTLLGFQYAMGTWAGEPAVRTLIPLYDQAANPRPGTTIVAKKGYAVGGLKIDAPKYVSAIQIIFQRIKPDDQLDPTDAYTSEWIGKPSQKEVPTITGNGKKAIGIQGRRGAIIDALGLLFK